MECRVFEISCVLAHYSLLINDDLPNHGDVDLKQFLKHLFLVHLTFFNIGEMADTGT